MNDFYPQILTQTMNEGGSLVDFGSKCFNFSSSSAHQGGSCVSPGPWCITFEFRDGDAYVLDFEQYH